MFPRSRAAGTAPQDTRVRSLWRDRDFGVFWAAQTLSVAGDSFAYIAVPLLVLQATGSVAQMGLLTGISGAASVGAGIFAGILVDRFDRRSLLICCDLARLVLYAVIPLAWAMGPQVGVLYVVLPAAEAVGMVFQVTYVAAVRNLVGEEQITEANGRLYATSAAAGILGPVLAGVMAGHFGLTTAIAINAASFAVSAVAVYLIRIDRRQAPAPTGAGTRAAEPDTPMPDVGGTVAREKRAWQELLAGVRFLWANPVLRTLTILLSFFIFLTLGLTDIVIYRLKHDLGQSDSTVGTVLGAAAVGTVAGALLVARLRQRLGFGPCWIGAQSVCGLAIAGIGSVGTSWGVAALMGVYLGCVSVAGICSMSLRQQVTPDHLLGRVTSAFWTIHFSMGPVGAAGLSWVAARFGATTVCVIAGTGCLLIAVAALFTPARRRHPERVVADT
ncbi:MFS family permease [Streptosporangium album]|uniref:MFS family permease n=1 Tax=Streptosporangium album TaxID=47479 RepID=A0A7W7S487_9ACTN|nr:MFS transporter [Streptosporangium album]MBB4942953.1 MFS family permease [Streptosporangium album]